MVDHSYNCYHASITLEHKAHTSDMWIDVAFPEDFVSRYLIWALGLILFSIDADSSKQLVYLLEFFKCEVLLQNINFP